MFRRFLSSFPANFVRNIRWQYVANLGAGALGGAYLLLLGNKLGVTEFGVFALCTAIATIAFNCLDLRLQEATVRFVAPSLHGPSQEDAATTIRVLFMMDVVARALALAIVLALAQIVDNVLLKGRDAVVEIVLAALMLFLSKAGNSPAVGLLRLVDRFDLHAWLQISDWGSKLVLTAILAVVTQLTVSNVLLIATVVGAAVNIALLRVALSVWRRQRAISGRFSWAGARNEFVRMRKFALSSQGISICDSVVREADTTIVGWYLSLEAVAIYRMTKNFVQLLWRAADPVFLVILPIITRFLLEGRKIELQLFLRNVGLLLFFAAALMVVSTALCLPWIIDAFLEVRFAEVRNQFPLMSWWIVISLPLIWTHALAAASGKPHLQLIANLMGNIVAAVLLLLITPAFGLAGAGLSWSLGLAATFVVSFVLLKRAGLMGVSQ